MIQFTYTVTKEVLAMSHIELPIHASLNTATEDSITGLVAQLPEHIKQLTNRAPGMEAVLGAIKVSQPVLYENKQDTSQYIEEVHRLASNTYLGNRALNAVGMRCLPIGYGRHLTGIGESDGLRLMIKATGDEKVENFMRMVDAVTYDPRLRTQAIPNSDGLFPSRRRTVERSKNFFSGLIINLKSEQPSSLANDAEMITAIFARYLKSNRRLGLQGNPHLVIPPAVFTKYRLYTS